MKVLKTRRSSFRSSLILGFLLIFSIIMLSLIAISFGDVKIAFETVTEVTVKKIFSPIFAFFEFTVIGILKPFNFDVSNTFIGNFFEFLKNAVALNVNSESDIICNVRWPRIATSILAGASLGLSGAIFQGLLLNPLADPYTLGVSSGAACGASVAILIGISNPFLLTGAAFIVALFTLLMVLILAYDNGRIQPTNLILAGVIISAILSAALSFQKYLAGDDVGGIVFWLMGSFNNRQWIDALIVGSFLIPSFLLAIFFAIDLNVMTLGYRSSDTLGINSSRVRLYLLLAASLAAAAAVSVSGIIGFVGLIIPHMIRLVNGSDHRSLLPLSALGGGLALLAADTIVRVVLPGEIPVGVLTAMLAGPAFLVIFRVKMKTADF